MVGGAGESVLVTLVNERKGKTMKKMTMMVVVGWVLCLAVSQAMAGDIYVDASVGGTGDGSTWKKAYTDLQSALAVALSGATIHVAQSTYKPTADTDRTATFLLNDMTLLGGYPAGGGERDPATYETILSGDIGTAENPGNAYHVVTTAESSVSLDGFTVTGGCADGIDYQRYGGGINAEGNLTVTNVTFSDNSGNSQYASTINIDLDIRDVTLTNVILWDNTTREIGYSQGDTVVIISNSVVRGGFTSGTNIITDDPKLGTLGNYGGCTSTIPLGQGSSAIDAADDAAAPDTDQGGVARPQGAGCDIGAYECRSYIRGYVRDWGGVGAVPSVVVRATPLGGGADWTAVTDEDGFYLLDGLPADTYEVRASKTWSGFDPGTFEPVTVVTVPPVNSSVNFVRVWQIMGDPTIAVELPDGGEVWDAGTTQTIVWSSFSVYSDVMIELSRDSGVTWEVVTGANYANFKGTGEINGYGSYKFKLWAGDGAADTFRIKIWTEDDAGVETIVYDNGDDDYDQAISGGNIVVHAN
jgi:hypothetical protein